jgi:hypothetical protein
VEAYLCHQASLRAPDDPENTTCYAKAMEASREAEQQRRLSSEEKYGKCWSAYDSGAVIDVDDSDGRAKRAGAEDNNFVYSSFWSKGGNDDGGDGGDEVDIGPCHF